MLAGASAHYEVQAVPTALIRELELNQVPAITWPYSFPFRFTLPKSAFCICKQGVAGSSPATSTTNFISTNSFGVFPANPLLLKQGAGSSDLVTSTN